MPLRTARLATPGTSLSGFARVDTDRLSRTGDPEVIYAAGKTPEEVVAVASRRARLR
jgi:NCAIR mutase (PurE)-related protein